MTDDNGRDGATNDVDAQDTAADVDADAQASAAEADAALEAAALAQAAGDDDADGPSSADYSVAFSPRNVAVGLAIVAGIVAFAVSRRRGKARREDD